MPETDEFLQQISSAYRTLPAGPPADVVGVQRAVRRRRSVRLAAAAGLVAACAVTGFVLADGDAGSLPVRRVGDSLSSESRSSDSAADWVRSADVVVVGTVASEQRTTSAAAADGSDDAFVSRTVTIDVGQQVWAADGVQAPKEVTIQAPGWVSSGGKLAARLTIGDSPRLEVGHTYVLALLKDRCGLAWQLLGSAGAIPYDDQTLGTGESGGEVLTATEDPGSRSGLARQVAGHDVTAVRTALDEARGRLEGRPEAPAC